jgi:amino acid permease
MAGPEDLGVSHTEVASKQNVVVSDKSDGLNVTADGTVIDHGLHRALKRRHLQMIALGGVIG